MSRIATIHQPHLLPWLGYYNKLASSDVFIIQDDVQFRKLYFQNRTFIKNMLGQKHRITIPVSFEHTDRIRDVRIAGKQWILPTLRTIEYSYRNTPYFEPVWSVIEDTLSHAPTRLIDITLPLLEQSIMMLGMTELEIVYSSDISKAGSATEQLITVLHSTESTACIFGEGGGLAYHDSAEFKNAGVSIISQRFERNHPVYAQKWGEFIPGLSVIDALFNIGPPATRYVIDKAWRAEIGAGENASAK